MGTKTQEEDVVVNDETLVTKEEVLEDEKPKPEEEFSPVVEEDSETPKPPTEYVATVEEDDETPKPSEGETGESFGNVDIDSIENVVSSEEDETPKPEETETNFANEEEESSKPEEQNSFGMEYVPEHPLPKVTDTDTLVSEIESLFRGDFDTFEASIEVAKSFITAQELADLTNALKLAKGVGYGITHRYSNFAKMLGATTRQELREKINAFNALQMDL